MTIVNCPKCREQVTIPVGASAEALVQCPLCHDEFPLARILMQLPPQLILVSDNRRTAAAAAVALPGVSEWSDNAEPELQESYALQTTAAVTDRDAPPFAFASDAVASTQKRGNRSVTPRSRSAGPIRQIIQVVFGGVVGVGLAQVILWWIPVELSLETRDLTGLGRQFGHYMPFLVPASVREPAISRDVARSTPPPVVPSKMPVSAAGRLQSQRPTDQTSDLRMAEAKQRPSRADGLAERPSSRPLPAPDTPDRNDDLTAAQGPVETSDGKPVDGWEAPLRQPGQNQPAPDVDSKAMDNQPLAKNELDTSTSGLDLSSPTAEDTPPATPLPTFSGSTVEARFDEAKTASVALDSLTNTDKTEKRRPVVAAFYMSLAELGEAFACSDPSDETVREMTMDAVNLLTRIAKQAERIALIETVTPGWLDNPRTQSGVCLVGTVKSVAACGQLFEMQLQLGDGRTLTLLSRHDPTGQLPPNSRILVLGAIVDDPLQKVAGYQGDATRAVLTGLYVSL